MEGLGHDVEPGDLDEDDERRGGVVEILVGLRLRFGGAGDQVLGAVGAGSGGVAGAGAIRAVDDDGAAPGADGRPGAAGAGSGRPRRHKVAVAVAAAELHKSRHLAEAVIGAAIELRQRVERNARKGGRGTEIGPQATMTWEAD